MKAMKLKSKWLMLACLAMMCGCSDEESEQNDTPVEVSDWTQLVLACQNGGTVEAPTRVALAADIKLLTNTRRRINGTGYYLIEGNGHTLSSVSEDEYEHGCYWGTFDDDQPAHVTFSDVDFSLQGCPFVLNAIEGGSMTMNDVNITITPTEEERNEAAQMGYITSSALWCEGEGSRLELNEGTFISREEVSGTVLAVQEGGTLVLDGGKIASDDFIRFTDNLTADKPVILLKRALDFPLTLYIPGMDFTGISELVLIKGEGYTLTEADLAQVAWHEWSSVCLNGENGVASLCDEICELYLNQEENAIKMRIKQAEA